MRVERVLLAVVGLAMFACEDLPRLAHGVCGNGVVEVGEDCDGTDEARCAVPGSVAACHYTCEDAACPDGWACSRDAICRHATGELVPGTTLALAHDDLAIGDVDGSGTGDVVAFGHAGARVAFGAHTIVASPDRLTGPGTVVDLDGDGRADVAVPLPGGIAISRGESDRTATPLGYAPFGVAPEAWLIPIGLPQSSRDDAVVVLQPTTTGVDAGMVLLPDGTEQRFVRLFDATTGAALGRAIARGDLDAPSVEDELVVVASGAREAWLLRPRHHDAAYEVSVTSLPLPVVGNDALTSDGRVALADVDADGDLDVLLGTLGVAGYGVAVATNVGTGAPSAPVVTSQFAALGTRPFPLAVGDIDGDGLLDAVSPDAVHVTRTAGLEVLVARSTSAPWQEAVIADIDGNGLSDLVLSSGLAGLEVLRQTSAGFTRVPIAAASPVDDLRAGDFDGDALMDVAFRERTPAGDRLRVLFGMIGALDAPASVLAMPAMSRIEVGRLPDTNGTSDGADDLVVVGFDGQRGALAFVSGAGDRRLHSLLALPRQNAVDIPLAVVSGRFTATTDDAPDLAVVTRSPAGDPAVWMLPAQQHAAFRVETAGVVAEPVAVPLRDLVIRRAIAADVDGDGLDELVVLGATTSGARLLILTASSSSPAHVVTHDLAIGIPLDLAAVDLDHDNRIELVVAGTAATMRIRDGSSETMPIGARSLAVAQLDDDPADELVVLGSGVLSVLDGSAAVPVRTQHVSEHARSVRAGDLDGDGVVDLIVGDGSLVTPWYSATQFAWSPP